MKVKFVDFDAQYSPIRQEIDSAIKDVIDSYYFVSGPKLKEFETNFANYIGTDYCAGVGSGTDALIVALKALGIGAGDEVVIPDQTYIATMSAVELVGAIPVIVPCDKQTFCIDPSVLEDFITDKTRALIYVHLYGNPGYYKEVYNICNKKGIFIIEDAAQAAGSEIDGVKCGNLGHIGCFSFYPAKNLGCFGQGGAITTNKKEIYDYVKRYANCGMENAEKVWGIGINSRLDDIQAAVLNVNLKHLDAWNVYRNIAAEIYRRNLNNFQHIPENCFSSYHLFVIKVSHHSPQDVIKYLNERGVEARQHYAFSMSSVCNLGGVNSLSTVSLPMHPYITEDEVCYVCDVVNEWG